MAKVELNVIFDIDIYLFFFLKKNMRDGASYISKRYGKAIHKYLTSSDRKKTGEIYYMLGQQ